MCKLRSLCWVQALLFSTAYALTPGPLGTTVPGRVGLWSSSLGLFSPCQMDLFHGPLVGGGLHPQLQCRLGEEGAREIYGALGARVGILGPQAGNTALSLGVMSKLTVADGWALHTFLRGLVGEPYKAFAAKGPTSPRGAMGQAAALEWWDLYHAMWGISSSKSLGVGSLTIGFQETLPRILRLLPPLSQSQGAHLWLVFGEYARPLGDRWEGSVGLAVVSIELGGVRLMLPLPLVGMRFLL